MKKLLFTLLPLFLLGGCAQEPTTTASEPPHGSYSVVLDVESSTLTTEDSTEAKVVTLKAKENEAITYQLEIGSPCYTKTVKGTSFQEIIMKNGGYFKAISQYKVSLLRCDIFEGKGVNYEVFNSLDASTSALEKKASTATPIYPEDSGAVYDYEVNAEGWLIRNVSANKPAFYSVTIFFEV